MTVTKMKKLIKVLNVILVAVAIMSFGLGHWVIGSLALLSIPFTQFKDAA